MKTPLRSKLPMTMEHVRLWNVDIAKLHTLNDGSNANSLNAIVRDIVHDFLSKNKVTVLRNLERIRAKESPANLATLRNKGEPR